MKNQTLFSSKDKSKTLKCRVLQCLFGALRNKVHCYFAVFVLPGTSTSKTWVLLLLAQWQCFWCKQHMLLSNFCFSSGAPVAQLVKHWPADLAIPGSRPT